MNYKQSTTFIKARLNQSVVSYNYKTYGREGDEVKIISDRDGVYIVENRNGERFSVRCEKVDVIHELPT